jgi:hypothetical protein
LLPNWKEVSGPSGAYLTRGCHVIVRCPQTWIPIYENQGHECLVVRAFEPILDAVNPNQFSSALDRHIAQRNIAVVQAASPAAIEMDLNLGYIQDPADAEVDVELDTPSSMEWLKIFTGKNDPSLQPTGNVVVSGFLPPSPLGSPMPHIREIPPVCLKPLLKPSERFHRGCDPLQVTFHADIQDIGPQQAQVLRIRQRINGNVIGGYSVVLIGK